jgi:hypothetical protein
MLVEGELMLRTRRESKRKKLAMTLMHDLQGSAAEIRMFSREFANEHPADLDEAEETLREFVPISLTDFGGRTSV